MHNLRLRLLKVPDTTYYSWDIWAGNAAQRQERRSAGELQAASQGDVGLQGPQAAKSHRNVGLREDCGLLHEQLGKSHWGNGSTI